MPNNISCIIILLMDGELPHQPNQRGNKMLELMDILHEPTHLEAFLLGHIYGREVISNKEMAVGYVKDYIADMQDADELAAYKSLAEIGTDFELYVEIFQEEVLPEFIESTQAENALPDSE